ncbi:hypothetical protein [Paraburkholderia phytofirmans]|uniref:hypothetical protein n=1 Tax=Paraburkholderia phytofirmans TaxID=261302 RepID=UPI0038BB48BB
MTELINGERFTPETAFHIETTLGLPDGFFDQPNPALAAETISRLRAPLDFSRATAESEPAYGLELDGAHAILANDRPTLTAPLLRESEMPKRIDGGAVQPVAKRKPVAAKTAPLPPLKPASPKAKATSKSGAQQSLPLNDAAILQNTRRANLHVLTSRKGSKVRLSTVMNISASNLDNRLYGQKRMDDTEASRFTERLGLPTGWLDVPRSVTDIPEPVSDLLDPLSGQPATDEQRPRAAIQPEPAVAVKAAGRKAKTARAGDTHTSVTDRAGDAAVTNAVAKHQSRVLPSVSDQVALQLADSNVTPPESLQQPAPASFTDVVEEPRRTTPVTSLDDLIGIAPIAEALIKTIAGKARTGRLDEMKALELLQQIVSL